MKKSKVLFTLEEEALLNVRMRLINNELLENLEFLSNVLCRDSVNITRVKRLRHFIFMLSMYA